MGFWVTFFLFVISTALSRALQPRPDVKPNRDFQLPTTEEGRAIPVVWGTVAIESPQIAWTKVVTSTSGPSEPGRSATPRLTFYSLVMHHILCHGEVDDILDIRFEKNSPASVVKTILASYTNFSINAQNLIARGVGVVADFRIYRGGLTQFADSFLEAKVGSAMPGFRGMCHAVIDGREMGAAPYLPAITYVVKRTPNQLGLAGGKHSISGGSPFAGSADANPACMLYELLTNNRWGCGLSPTLIDTAGFIAAGNTLFDEGFGMSMMLDRPAEANEVMLEILRHIDGVIFVEPTNGLLTLKLAREDYDVGTLPVFNQSNSRNPRFSRPAETRNVVKVKYVDRYDGRFMERVAQEQDLANIQSRDGQVSIEEIDFPGISLPAVAQKVAARELKSLSYPTAPVELEVNREGWDLRPGSVFKWSWPPYGIENMVLRVGRIRGGTLTDGWISIECVEDIFAVDGTGYPAPSGSGWVDPVSDSVPLAAQRLVEAPYTIAGGQHRLVMTLGVRGAVLANGYQVWSDPAGGTAYTQTEDVRSLTPSAVLSGALTPTSTALGFGSAVDTVSLRTATAAELAAGLNVMLIDDELIAWQTLTDNGDGTFAISGMVRGVMDTTPKAHSAGSRIYFVTGGFGFSSLADYVADLTLTAKLLPYNSRNVLAIGSASQISVVTNNRAARPYVPAAVRLNGLAYPTSIDGALTVSWSHRNRLGVWTYDNAGAVGSPEPGTTYTLRLYGNAGTLLRTYSGISGTSQTWTDEASDSGGELNTNLCVELEAVVSGLVSFQLFNHSVSRTPADATIGNLGLLRRPRRVVRNPSMMGG